MGQDGVREKVLLSWSGGKDSAMALHALQQARTYEVSALLTTVTQGYDRISMHGVRRTLLERQAAALNLKLYQVTISKGTTNREYEAKMELGLKHYHGRGVRAVAFGDIFLEDLRSYREGNLARLGMQGLFPIWKRDTGELVRAFIDLGFKAVVVCVDTRVLDLSFAGQTIDKDFLERLPAHVDPCGEYGEFHSFVYDGPLFKEPVRFSTGEVAVRETHFGFCDLVPNESILT